MVTNDAKFKQLTLDMRGKLTKNLRTLLFNITLNDWSNLIKICKADENFDEVYVERFQSYLDAIYLFDASTDLNKNNVSEPFDILDVDNCQALDNNAICYKHIDYVVNKDAKTFADIFTFVEANENIQSNLKSNSCYFNIILSTYK